MIIIVIIMVENGLTASHVTCMIITRIKTAIQIRGILVTQWAWDITFVGGGGELNPYLQLNKVSQVGRFELRNPC